ncbi:MAG: T9SS type A sorting domain-containing protein [Chitinophagaceae bacterium]|nr:T9SS type A sorting domain-containing protein [Chitinophagaceae bacterium]
MKKRTRTSILSGNDSIRLKRPYKLYIPVILAPSAFCLLTILAMLTAPLSSSARDTGFIHRDHVPGDSILIQKQIASKKHKIELYSNADQQALFFGAQGSDDKAYQLYLFDMEGRLIKQSEIRNKQTALIKNIEKGNYFFDVFSDDERIENGQIIVR